MNKVGNYTGAARIFSCMMILATLSPSVVRAQTQGVIPVWSDGKGALGDSSLFQCGQDGDSVCIGSGMSNFRAKLMGFTERDNGSGVYGEATSPTGAGTTNAGVIGVNRATTDDVATGSAPAGVRGWAIATTGKAVGVHGLTNSPDGVGVVATGAGPTSTALQIFNGAVQVAGAGLNTATPVFVVRPPSAGVRAFFINHPLTNGDPNAILIVTAAQAPGALVAVPAVSAGYDFNIQQWFLLTTDGNLFGASFSVMRYNVLVIKP